MRPIKLLTSALIASLLLTTTVSASMYTSTWSWLDPRFSSGSSAVHSICMMPPRATLLQLTMKTMRHPESDPGESQAWAESIQKVVQNHLKAAGLDTLSAAGSDDPAIQPALLDLQQKFAAISPALYKKPKDIEKAQPTLGGGAAQLPCAAKSDLLLFVEAEGKTFSTSRAILVAAFHAGNNDDTSKVFLTFVDPKSGQVAGFLRIEHGHILDSIYDPEKSYSAPLDKEFKKMNLGAPASSHP